MERRNAMRTYFKAMSFVALILTAAWLAGPAWGAQASSSSAATSTANAELKVKLDDSTSQAEVDKITALVESAAGDTGRVRIETEPGETKIKAERVSLTSNQVVSLIQAVEMAGGKAEIKMEHVVLSETDLKALVDSLATAPTGLKMKLEGKTTDGLPFELKLQTKKGKTELKVEGAKALVREFEVRTKKGQVEAKVEGPTSPTDLTLFLNQLEASGKPFSLKVERVTLTTEELQALVDTLRKSGNLQRAKIEGRTPEGNPFEVKVQSEHGTTVVKAEGVTLAGVQGAKPKEAEAQKQATQLQAQANQLNAKATAASSSPAGTQRVTTRLAQTFQVPESKVTSLHEEKKLGFGEIGIALALAQEVSTRDKVSMDVAIDRILAKREDGEGWGRIARDMDLKLGRVISEVKKAEKNVAASQIPERGKTAHKLEKVEKAEKPEKVERQEKVERAERVEKVQRTERLGRVERRAERIEKIERPERLERVERREREERKGKD